MKIITRKEALEQGLSKYFTGKPCIHGHLCERYTYPTLRTGKCVECVLANNKKWRKKFPERKKKSNKIWEDNNHDKFKECQRQGQRKYRNSALGQLRKLSDTTFYRLEVEGVCNSKFEMLDYTADELSAHLLKNTEFSSIKEAKEAGYTIDHIVPLKYTSEKIKDKILAFRVAMDLTNLRLIHREENTSKKDRIDLPIVQETIKLLWNKYNLNEKGGKIAA